jgi:hypothetical protein
MGYHTDFHGVFELDRPLKRKHARYLLTFSDTRRMARNTDLLPKDKLRERVELPAGIEGEFFVGSPENMGQNRCESIIDYNRPPSTQPGLWCNWTVGDEYGNPLCEKDLEEEGVSQTIVWNEGEKFYNYVEWLDYLIKSFLIPWGYVLNGEVEWRGEEWEDSGTIRVENNTITVVE